jgi:putative ABC transport system ATP-binding protein
VIIAGHDLGKVSSGELLMLRRTTIGFVFQNPSLLPALTAQENIELPLALNGWDAVARRDRAVELLAMVELADKSDTLPESLSGGQQQRVSIARALAARPPIILADEPAGSLDSVTAETVLSLIADVASKDGTTLVMVTHEEDDAQYADRIVRLKDGALVQSEVSG